MRCFEGAALASRTARRRTTASFKGLEILHRPDRPRDHAERERVRQQRMSRLSTSMLACRRGNLRAGREAEGRARRRAVELPSPRGCAGRNTRPAQTAGPGCFPKACLEFRQAECPRQRATLIGRSSASKLTYIWAVPACPHAERLYREAAIEIGSTSVTAGGNGGPSSRTAVRRPRFDAPQPRGVQVTVRYEKRVVDACGERSSHRIVKP